MIFWFTGQPGHGKSALACRLKEFIENKSNKKVFVVDGDHLRGLTSNNDFSEEGRRSNIQLAQKIVRFLDSNGYDVVVALVSPFRDLRESFKSETKCAEIYVHTDQIRGREHFHVKYEPPISNYLDIDTSVNIDECLEKIINHFKLS